MTTDECEQLITEIKKERLHHEPSDAYICSYERVEKIIKRFDNRPPYRMQGLYGNITLYQHNLDNEFHLSCIASIYVTTISFNLNQLKDLRDKINLMLEYLNDE